MNVIRRDYAIKDKPKVELTVAACEPSLWYDLGFHRHHYMTEDLNPSSKCYLVRWNGVAVAFVALLPQLSSGCSGSMRFSRIVVMPDYQGLGLVGRLMDFFGGVVKGERPSSTLYMKTIHPRVGAYMGRSSNWEASAYNQEFRDELREGKENKHARYSGGKARASFCFKYVGPPLEGYGFLLNNRGLAREIKDGQGFFDFFDVRK